MYLATNAVSVLKFDAVGPVDPSELNNVKS